MFVCSSVWGEFRGSRHGNLRSNNKTESEPAAPDGAEKWVDSVSVAEFKRLNIQNVQDQQNITGLLKKKDTTSHYAVISQDRKNLKLMDLNT